MVKKSEEEKLIELEEKIKQLQARKQKIANAQKQKERKARTKRLIEVGAIFEKYFEIEGQEQAEIIAKNIQSTVKTQKMQWINSKKGNYEKKKEMTFIKNDKKMIK